MKCREKQLKNLSLEGFITSVLTQIINSVNNVQEYISKNSIDGVVNPPRQTGVNGALKDNLFVVYSNENETIYGQYINFDVEVGAMYSSEAGAQLSILASNLGGKLKSNNNNLSRVQFSIPIVLPTHETKEMEEYRKKKKEEQIEREKKEKNKSRLI